MTWNEWIELVQVRQALFDRVPAPDGKTLKVQYEFIKGVPYDAALAALKAEASNDWPPNPGQLAEKALELVNPPEPDFDQVVAAFRTMVGKSGGRWDTTTAPRHDDWLQRGFVERVASFFDVHRWKLWCQTPESDRTFYAQQRDEYHAARGRHEREQRLLASGVDRAQLERPARSEPRKLKGFGELAGLPSPSEPTTNNSESNQQGST